MALIKEFFELTKKYENEFGPNTIFFMQVGAFFEIYGYLQPDGSITGSKISELSKLTDLKIAMKDKNSNLMMLGFRDYSFDKWIRKIQDAGYTIVAHDQDPIDPTKRQLMGIFSPGTFFNTEPSLISNNTMCIWIEKVILKKKNSIIFGISNVDIYTGRVSIFESMNEFFHNPISYDELERFVTTYNPSETIIISNMSEEEINDIENFSNIQSKIIHKIFLMNPNYSNTILLEKAKKCQKQNYIHQVLQTFYGVEKIEIIEHSLSFYEYASQSLSFLLNFLFEHNPNLVNKIREPIFENKSDRVILANHSLKQLNIIDDSNFSGKLSSISKFLNNCVTPMGIRQFNYKLVNPTFNVESLEKEYEITEYLLQEKDKYNYWRKECQLLKDIEKLQRQICLKKINPVHFYHLFHNLRIISELYENLHNTNELIKYLQFKKIINEMFEIENISTFCKKIQLFISDTLDIEKCLEIENMEFDKNFIKEGVSENLDFVVCEYEDSNIELIKIQQYLDSCIAKTEKSSIKKYEYVKLHETEKLGLSLETTKRRATLLEEQIKKEKKKEIIIDYISFQKKEKQLHVDIGTISHVPSSSSNAKIVNSQINGICEKINKSKIKMKDEITEVYKYFVTKFLNFENEIKIIVDFVSILDILQNQCYIANKYNYCKPNIIKSSENNSYVDAKELRHCLIEQLNTKECYVTNDISIGRGGSTSYDVMLLYGTNAVGKTSLIRALGVAVIMAQAGLYVPCKSLVYYPYKTIFTRILGNDNLFKGMSTFMVEMSELRNIIKYSDENSLILGDELCSGTEIDSAISIFVAGLHTLHEKKSTAIFATHLHEINKYEEITNMKRLVMMHLEVSYDKESDSLVFDRKLKAGPGFSIYGLEVCKSLHLPEDFLEYANQIRLKYRNNEQSILNQGESRYNAKKVRGLCEVCGKEMGVEVHHLEYQKDANKNNYIESINKNHPGNLINICENCHDKIHKEEEKLVKKKTTRGVVLKKK